MDGRMWFCDAAALRSSIFAAGLLVSGATAHCEAVSPVDISPPLTAAQARAAASHLAQLAQAEQARERKFTRTSCAASIACPGVIILGVGF